LVGKNLAKKEPKLDFMPEKAPELPNLANVNVCEELLILLAAVRSGIYIFAINGEIIG